MFALTNDQHEGLRNPDLAERLAAGAPLAEVDWATVYAAGRRGYADYPTIQDAIA
jgi:N-ethylmaleimide reductase